jgi:hypothetical protein
MSAADLDSMNESGIDPEEDSSWESEDGEMAPDYDRVMDEDEDDEEDLEEQEDFDDDMDDDFDEEVAHEDDDDGTSSSRTSRHSTRPNNHGPVAHPIARNTGWRLSLLSVGGGPLVLATVGAAQRVILAPTLRRLAGGASAIRRSRLRAATAAAAADDDDARVWTRAAAADGPSEGGLELADAGLFGNNDRRTARTLRAKRVARRVLEREIGGAAYGREKVEAQLAKHVGDIWVAG